MSPHDRAKSKLTQAKRLVVKIGSRALVNRRGKMDLAVFRSVAADVAALRGAGVHTVVVSSGAILAGRARLGLLDHDLNLREKQAVAAVGQNHLMGAWSRELGKHGLIAAQMLVTAEDLADRARYLNSRNTIEELFKLGAVPVINENDTVAVAEIRYGDNDHISTLVAGLVNADGLILLTDIDGLCVEDPAVVKDAPVVHLVRESDVELFACAGPSSSGVGSGGMATKIEAARTVARMGVPTVIANAKQRGVISRIMAGSEIGTLFVPEGQRLKDRQYWMAFAGGEKGSLVIDDGAARAVVERGKSLLASGITAVKGRFVAGDLVGVVDESGRRLARGLTQYSAEDLKKIRGRKSSEIAAILGQKLYDEAIHRDYLVLT